MAKRSVLISLKTMIKTEERVFGRKFIESLVNEDARLEPELVSWEERFKEPFVDVDHFVADWWAIPVTARREGDPPYSYFLCSMWKRKSSLAGRGMVNHGSVNMKNQRTPSNLWFESRWARDVDFAHLFAEWVALSQPECGMLHIFTQPEVDFLRDEEEGWAFEVGTFGGPAKPGIPNMGWAMAYGGEYLAEVDTAAITKAGFPLQQVGEATIVQVTEKLSDIVDDFPFFSRRRAELKQLFRPGVFLIKDEPKNQISPRIH